jgi:hypothetical protein
MSAAVAVLDTVLASVSRRRLAATVAELAADRYAGRRVGTRGNAAARSWLTGQLTAIGATITTDSFPVPAVPDWYAPVQVSFGRDTATTLVFGRDVAVPLASADASAPIRAPLAVAASGAPDGHWLVVPADTPLPRTGFENAAGLIVVRGADGDGWQYTMLAGPHPGPLPVLTVASDRHRELWDAAVAGGGWLSANTPIRRRDATATNVHARFRDAMDGRPDMLLTAHYDGVGDVAGLRLPGAADNASGVAVVLESARLLAPVLPDGNGLFLALLDAEEVGAFGSARHAANLTAAGAGPTVVNVDGVGQLRQAAAVEAGGPAHRLLAALDQAGRHTGVPLTAGPVASDNRRYAAEGLASVGIGAGMAGYHSPADTPNRVAPDTLTAITRLVIAAVWWYAASPETFHRSAMNDER